MCSPETTESFSSPSGKSVFLNILVQHFVTTVKDPLRLLSYSGQIKNTNIRGSILREAFKQRPFMSYEQLGSDWTGPTLTDTNLRHIMPMEASDGKANHVFQGIQG